MKGDVFSIPGILMLIMVAWVLMAALVAGLFALVSLTLQKISQFDFDDDEEDWRV